MNEPERAADAAERLSKPTNHELYADLARVVLRHGSTRVLAALREACESVVDVAEVQARNDWRDAERSIRTARMAVHRAERFDGPDLVQALEMLSDGDEEGP